MNKLENKKAEQNLKILQQISKDSPHFSKKNGKRFRPKSWKNELLFRRTKKERFGKKSKILKNNPNKLNYVYILTPKGLSYRALLTLNFMKKKCKNMIN